MAKRNSRCVGAKMLINLAVGTAVAMPFMAGANLITNGSFESGNFVANSGVGIEKLSNGDTSITGWTVNGGDGGDITWESNAYQYNFLAQNGDKKLDLTGYGNDGTVNKGGISLSQGVATTIGQKYLLTFWMGSSQTYNGGHNPQITVTVNGNPTTFTTTDGNSSLPDSPGGANNHWQEEQFLFTATQVPTTIAFQATTAGYDNVIELDNISLTAVPEASTVIAGALLLLPLGLSGLRAIRRKQTA